MGFAELGLLVQASSSNPLVGAAELARGGGCTAEIAALAPITDVWGDDVLWIWSEAVEIESRSTVDGNDLLGCGRPRLGALFFKAPPGPAKRLGGGLAGLAALGTEGGSALEIGRAHV